MKNLHNSEKSITTFQCLSKEGPERLVSGQSLRKQLTGEKEIDQALKLLEKELAKQPFEVGKYNELLVISKSALCLILVLCTLHLSLYTDSHLAGTSSKSVQPRYVVFFPLLINVLHVHCRKYGNTEKCTEEN